MGEVYRATDSRLGREVAIKVLSGRLSGDEEHLQRFQREARVLASTNHPNIAALHGLENHDETSFLILELVEGETLEERLRSGPLPLDEAISVFAQIADGLEAAHERDIVHRDIKPSNLKITDEGRVKILDFGLARRPGSTVSVSAEDATRSVSSMPEDITTGGTILGTPAYMSPEQARGKPVDKRSDVWSFGCCLLEALGGVRPFTGETVADVIARILEATPDWSTLPRETPHHIRLLLWRCLQKDPRRRLRDIGEARFVLGDPPVEPPEAVSPGRARGAENGASSRHSPGRTLAALILGGLAVGLIGWLSGLISTDTGEGSPLRPIRRTTINLGPGESWPRIGPLPWLSLSPDGKNLAYIARRDGTNTFLRPLDQLKAHALPGGEGAFGVRFSRDGEWIGLYRDDGNWMLPLAGGRPSQLATTAALRAGMSWGSDGEVYFSEGLGTGLHRVQSLGGKPEVVTTLREGEVVHMWPEPLPGGEALLFVSVAMESEGPVGRVEAYRIREGERRLLLEGSRFAHYLPTGHLIYTDREALMAVPFDPVELRTSGPPVVALSDVRIDPTSGCPQLTFSRDGTLVYVSRGPSTSLPHRLVWVDRQGAESPLDQPPRAFGLSRVSPDGFRITTQLEDAGNTDIHVLDLARGSLSRITFDPAGDSHPVWSRDGSSIYFSSTRTEAPGIYRKRADGKGAAELVAGGPGLRFPGGLSPDGSLLLLGEVHPKTSLDIGLADLRGTDEIRPLLNQPHLEAGPSLSPDGKWIAYQSDASGRSEIYVQDFPDLDGKWQVSTEGGMGPVWSPGGGELFFSRGGALWSVAILETEPTFITGSPGFVFEGPYLLSSHLGREYDISPGGERFLVLRSLERTRENPDRDSMIVVENWFEELLRLAPLPD